PAPPLLLPPPEVPCALACDPAYMISPTFCAALPSVSACASSCSFVASLFLTSSSASLTAASILVFSSAPIFSPYSPTDFFPLCPNASSWFLDCTTSTCLRSSSACASASFIIRLISSSVRPELALILVGV